MTTSPPGVSYDNVVWPKGMTPIARKPGTLAHGDTWVIRDDVPEAIDELERRKTKVEAAIKLVTKEIARMEDDLARTAEEGLTLEEEWEGGPSAADVEVYGAERATPYAATEDIVQRAELESQLEHKATLLTKLEDELERVINEIEAVKATAFQASDVTEPTAALPSQLRRVDVPTARPDPHAKRDVPVKPADTKSGTDEAPPQALYCAKLLSPGLAYVASDEVRVFKSQRGAAPRTDDTIRALVREGTDLVQSHAQLLSPGERFAALGIAPLIAVRSLEQANPNAPSIAAFISPFYKNGSIEDALLKITGKRKQYWFQDDLLLNNLRVMIRTMALLQLSGIYHGNIKPSNIYISGDGSRLLIGDFLPESEVQRWFGNIVRSLTAAPTYSSPELHQLLVVRRVKDYATIKNSFNFYKHDVFCLGLVFLYAATRLDPKNAHQKEEKLKKLLGALVRDKHDPELVNLLEKMLVFDPQQRESFWDMLSFGERVSITGQNVLNVMKGILGTSPV